MELVASLTPAAECSPFEALAQPPEGVSLVELRLDLFPGLDLGRAVSASRLPLLATLRSQAEGGLGPDDPALRRACLAAAYEAGAALIDLEADRDLPLLRSLGIAPEQVVLSWHDPAATPSDLGERAARLLGHPARWVKVVPTATSLRDLERVLTLHHAYNAGAPPRRRLITFAMGEVARPSRYLAPLLGPPIAFVAFTSRSPAAPGQLSVSEMLAVVSHLDAAPARLYGVVGSDVGASLSPVLHSVGYRAHDLPYLFVPLSVPDEAELELLFAPRGSTLFDRAGLPAHGWAVTAPYKARAVAAAAHAAPRARRAGAANTLLLREASIVAENTDADGVTAAIRRLGVEPAARVAIVAGSGGAARGAAVGLDLAGARVVLRGRHAGNSEQVAAELGVESIPPNGVAPEGAILVNATPLGREPGDRLPFTRVEVGGAAAVVDMVYGLTSTPLAALAAELEVPLADGRDVLVLQALGQYAAFTGRLAPEEAMRAAIRR